MKHMDKEYIEQIEKQFEKQDQFNQFTFKMLIQMFQSVISIVESMEKPMSSKERDELNQTKGILKTLNVLFTEFMENEGKKDVVEFK